jgi:hypothetical protein
LPKLHLAHNNCGQEEDAVRAVPQKPKLVQIHVMKICATPAKLVAIVRATDEQAALAEVIARHRMPTHLQKRLIALRTT